MRGTQHHHANVLCTDFPARQEGEADGKPHAQAQFNGVKKALAQDNGEFDRVLGDGSSEEVMGVIAGRFNFDCKPPPGRKVGLLDLHHMWCFMMDPYNSDWRGTLHIDANICAVAKAMIAHFISADEKDADQIRDDLLEEFTVSRKIDMLTFVECSFLWLTSFFYHT